MDREFIPGKMVQFMKETSKEVLNTGKENGEKAQ